MWHLQNPRVCSLLGLSLDPAFKWKFFFLLILLVIFANSIQQLYFFDVTQKRKTQYIIRNNKVIKIK